MSKKDEISDLEDTKKTIKYFEDFIEITEYFADGAHIDEIYEVEAPCRAAIHHINVLLGHIRSVEEDLLPEIPTGETKRKIPYLKIVKK